MSEIRVYRATTFPVAPKVNAIYVIEDDTNLEFHYVDAAGNHTFMKPSTVIAALGTTTNLTALVPAAASISVSNFTASNAAEPTKAEIDAGIDALKDKVITALALKADNVDAETLRTEVEARLDAIEAKVDATLAALKVGKLMKTS